MSQTHTTTQQSKISHIRGYEGVYSVTSDGKVYSHRSHIWLKQMLGKRGYPRVMLSNKGKTKNAYVHRLVAETFIPNPYLKPSINHVNGVKADNNVSNLEWVTSKENRQHAMAIGLVTFGIEHNFTNTTTRDVNIIRR